MKPLVGINFTNENARVREVHLWPDEDSAVLDHNVCDWDMGVRRRVSVDTCVDESSEDHLLQISIIR